jgi:glucose-1-phosphatase
MRKHDRWLFLDLGNVVVDVDKDRARALFEQRCGLGREDFDWVFFDSGLLDRFNVGRVTPELFEARVRDEVRFKGRDISPAHIREVWRAMLIGRREVLDWLAAITPAFAGVWVISDINVIHWRAIEPHLAPLGLKGATLSFELGQCKPELDVFRDALTRSGAKASRAVFIDDVLANVQGAQAVGMHAVLYDYLGQVAEQVNAWLAGKKR